MANPNGLALLKTISTAEGGNYYALNAGKMINDLSAFPLRFAGAAGEYQFEKVLYDEVSNALGLHDWSPATQDEMAAYVLITKGASQALQNGNLATAILDASKAWAAVPEGAGSLNHSRYNYESGPRLGQPQPSLDYNTFVSDYHANGGH